MAHYRSIFVSDLHLGARASQAELFSNFLKNNTCDNLFLVGDIIDGWRLKRKWYWPQSHTDAIRRILTAAKRDTRVYYIPGNHDESIRKFLAFDITFGRIKFFDRYIHIGANGKRYLVIHGDQFDGLMMPNRKWLMHVGDVAYNMLVWFNTHLNTVRGWIGRDYWSLSQFLKSRTKSALNYINSFEDHLAEHCLHHGYDGVICGHIHTPVIKTVNDVAYMNTGDMCESISAIVEDYDGNFHLVDAKTFQSFHQSN